MFISKTRMLCHGLAAVFGMATPAIGSVVHWDCALAIPADYSGVYVNVETRATGSSAAAVPDWDINIFGPTSVRFGAGTGAAYVALSTSASPSNLPAGTVVDGSSTFSTSTTAAVFASNGWFLNAANYFGFRFTAADGLTHYGFGRMDVGASASSRTLAFLEFESLPGGPVTVPGPGSMALLASAGAIGWRRRAVLSRDERCRRDRVALVPVRVRR